MSDGNDSEGSLHAGAAGARASLDEDAQGGAGVLLHVGYHKTGSTWLQERLFAEPGVAGFQSWDSRDLSKAVVRVNALAWDAATTRAHFRVGLAAARSRGLVSVLSSERLSGHPFTGGYDTEVIARRLAAVFPGARVLIVIREQRDMLLSVYRAYVRDGGTADLRSFLSPRRGSPYPMFRWDYHAYHRAIALYQSLFGRAHVLTMAFEQLRAAPEAFAAAVATFAGARAPTGLPGAPVNEALSVSMTAFKRLCNVGLAGDLRDRWGRANRTLVALCQRAGGLVPASVEAAFERGARREIDTLATGHYGASNRETTRLTGLDLQAMGYLTD